MSAHIRFVAGENMKFKSKKYLGIIFLITFVVLVSGCTININTGDSEKEHVEIESDNEAIIEQVIPTPPPRPAPQTSIRAFGGALEHQGGDEIDLSEVTLKKNGLTWTPLCSQSEMFRARDKLTFDPYTFTFTLNGNLINTTYPTGSYNAKDNKIKLIDIPTQQLIADLY